MDAGCGACGGGHVQWQCGCGGASAALGEVFAWLEGEQLAVAARVCRAWRAAANAAPLWRRALARRARLAPDQLRRVTTARRQRLDSEGVDAGWDEDAAWWRGEFALVAAGWRKGGQLRPKGGSEGATLLHAALQEGQGGAALALAAEDAHVSVWVGTEHDDAGNGGWRAVWSESEKERGWRAAARVQWAPAPGEGLGEGGRLLVAGPLALVDRWEALVVAFDEEWRGRVVCRAASGADGGAWVARDAFATLLLCRAAPQHYVTTVWLNAAHQAPHSEFAGVAKPLLRIYNEAQAHISHVVVAGEQLLCACGEEGGAKGVADSLGAWTLPALRVPELRAADGGGLRERVARRRLERGSDRRDESPPSEQELRALCAAPTARASLRARVLALTLQMPGCVWATCADGALRGLRLPRLSPLRELLPPSAPRPAPPLCLQNAASPLLLASPSPSAESRPGDVVLFSARSFAPLRPPPAPARPPPPLCTLLPAAPPLRLLVLAGDALYTWESRAPAEAVAAD